MMPICTFTLSALAHARTHARRQTAWTQLP